MKRDTCKHFTGIGQDCCEAGVNYRELAGEPQFGMALRLPCIERAGGMPNYDPAKVVPCEKREAPTAEDVAAFLDAVRERYAKTAPLTSDGDEHHIWQCNLCPGAPWPQFTDATAYVDHLVAAHDMRRPLTVSKEMATHLDATTWHQTNYAHYLPGTRSLIGFESHRYPRQGSDRALWADASGKPKRKRGKR
jgi:hypothetical protein